MATSSSSFSLRRLASRHGKRGRPLWREEFRRRCLSSDEERRLHPSSELVDVSPLADEIRKQCRAYTKRLEEEGRKPLSLVGILGPTGKYAELYSDRIAETCREDGISYSVLETCGDEPSDVERAIREAKDDVDVDGILVFYPIFHRRVLADEPASTVHRRLRGVYYKSYDDHLRHAVCPTKDVEGLCREHNSRFLFRSKRTPSSDWIFPCTALSVKQILDYYHLKKSPFLSDGVGENFSDDAFGVSDFAERNWRGQTVTIVNRSEILGRPLAAMLASCGATVYSVDAHSILEFRHGGILLRRRNLDLERCLQISSVVVTGVPDPEFRLPAVEEGVACVVNVSEHDNVADALRSSSSTRFVPHIGKVTVAVLMQNLMRLRRRAENTNQTS